MNLQQSWAAKVSALFLLVTNPGFAQEASSAGSTLQTIELPFGSAGTVTFSSTATGKWNLNAGTPNGEVLAANKPVHIEVFRAETEIKQLDSGYDSVEKGGGIVLAKAELHDGRTAFLIQDEWKSNSGVLSVQRRVEVKGNAPGGFLSGLTLSTGSSVQWSDLEYFVPSALYVGPGENNPTGGTGSNAFASKRFSIREDAMPAPLIGFAMKNGKTLTMLDPAPRGDSTDEDNTRTKVATVLIDDKLRFGAFGAQQTSAGVEFGYWYPGSISQTGRSSAGNQNQRSAADGLRRYHRITNGFTQQYSLAFRFGEKESFPELTKNSWRWAWQTLKPPVNPLDVDLVRRVLLDHLADRVTTIGGRSGIPWIFQVTTGQPWHRPDDMRAVMGFVGKNIEAADQLLRESDRDTSARGQRMRQLGLSIIDSFIKLVPLSPPVGEGFDLLTGEPTVSFPPSSWRGNLQNGARVFIRAPSEDLRRLLETYAREKAHGRDHPDWLRWAQQFADWLLPQQRPDGSFPRAWRPGTDTVVEPSGTSSYNPVPMLVNLSRVTGANGTKYREAATRAAEFIWNGYGAKGFFVGGTMDNPNVIDKEAGMLSLEAFLSLYDVTHDQKWVTRAQVAANFAETWMWIWNVPIPDDASDGELHWKKGVPTIGLQGITVRTVGGCDEFLDWSAPAFAKLYKLTNDKHYLDVARILLHDTKAMVALPGRTYDMAGPGWQQENFNLSARRGFGGHRGWLPWVSVNHLWSITGVEELDSELFRQISSNADSQ